MKLKRNILVGLSIVVIFIAAQSFYSNLKYSAPVQPRVWLGPTGHVALCGAPFLGADPEANIPALKGWGHYFFKITGAADSVQFYFNQGINLYYGFHTIESIASFTKATILDPNNAMAWYGKALAMGPTINYENGYRPPTGAFEAAVKSMELSANCTPVEKALIKAIQSRYSADTTANVKQLRINYADAMKAVYQEYPTNADVATLYADALLLLHPWDLYNHDLSPKPWTPQLQQLLQRAIALSPSHPGANHYYIHTMEASATPGMALKSAHLLDTLMPEVAHMVHMSSHIYIRTGYYQQGITNNDNAVAGYEGYVKRYAPVANGVGLYKFHAVDVKLACAQMGGNYKTAIAGALAVKEMALPYLAIKGGFGNLIQYGYVEYLLTDVRFGKWDDVLKSDVSDTLVFASLLQHFAKGIAYSAKGMTVDAQKELAGLQRKLQDTTLKQTMDNTSTPQEVGTVAELILKGYLYAAKKQYTAAIATLQQAVVAEDHFIYNEPRAWALPARQYLADAMIKARQYQQAIAVLNKDLTIYPANIWDLTGLQTCYQQTKNTAGLSKTKQELAGARQLKDLDITKPVF